MQRVSVNRVRGWVAVFVGGLAVACNAGGTSESDAQGARSQLRNAASDCTCQPERQTVKSCVPLPEAAQQFEQSSEADESGKSGQAEGKVGDWKTYNPGDKITVKADDLAEFELVYGDSMVCTTRPEVTIDPRGPRATASGEKQWRESSSLAKCSSLARQAVWSQSFAFASANFCVEDRTLTGTDPKSPWYGKSGAALIAVQNRIVAEGTNGSKSKGNKYACQCQREEGCILFRPDPLAKGQSMFMDEYAAFFFENHQQLVTWGFCKKHL